MRNICATSVRFFGSSATSFSDCGSAHLFHRQPGAGESPGPARGYKKKEHIKATFASRSMVLSGLVVLAFIVFHLAHFTARVTDPRFRLLKNDPLNHYDVYSMMVYGFQNVYVSVFYIIGCFCSRCISATARRAFFNRSV